MADKTSSPGHAMFGLNEETKQPAAETKTAPSPPPGAPQYVYLQAPPAASGGKVLPWLVVALLVVSVGNLVLELVSRSQNADIVSKQADQLTLLAKRLDSSDERYAQLRGQFQVTSEKLGLTEQELSRARSLAVDIQKQQQTAVQQLNDAISKKASAEEVDKVQADANAKIGGVSADLAGTKKDLEATKEALSGTRGELTGAIARTHDELVALAHKTDRDYLSSVCPNGAPNKKSGP